jgi:hypothetical protein
VVEGRKGVDDLRVEEDQISAEVEGMRDVAG